MAEVIVHEHDGETMNLAWQLTEEPLFERTVLAVILLNTALLVVGLFIEDHAAFELLHHVILTVFVAELLIKMAAVRWRLGEFLRSKWNIFDTLVIALSLVPFLGSGAMVLRMARLARLLHSARHIQHLRVVELIRR
jgi:voltage-gated sodium channel